MKTYRNRRAAIDLCKVRNANYRPSAVVEGPSDGEWTVMDERDAEEFGEWTVYTMSGKCDFRR